MSMRRSGLLLPGLLLAGCIAVPAADPGDGKPPSSPPPVREVRVDTTDAAKALAYYAQVRQLTGTELAREQDAARRELARVRSEANRVRYALLLTLPGTPAVEEARVPELLEPVTRSSDSELRGLALLMTAFMQEQRRLETSAQGLQQKLDALLTLERSMTGRDGGATRKK